MTHPPEIPPAVPPENSRGTSGLTRNERIALLFFFIMAIAYAGWQYYSRSRVQVELGEDIPGGIVVQVEGAVANPGTVFLNEGARVSDAIEAAGGFTAQADTSAINPDDKAVHGGRIFVPYVNQSDTGRPRESAGNVGRIIGGVDYPFSHDMETGDEPETEDGLVDINVANRYELQVLPGIGEQLALRIVEYRDAHGPFDAIEDIMLVDGIGEARFEGIRGLIKAGD